MTDPFIERLDLASEDIVAERVARLREDFPEVFEDGVINFDALQRSLGKWVDPGKERFGLTWPGKAACMRTIQQPSTGTLRPDRAESVDFDTTQNVIIEGENLEVLKLLQKSYYGKVKMIYIDPPYNTGQDFVYPDDYREPMKQYLRFSGQLDDEGTIASTNLDAIGRVHSNWLNMMYPRLFLARSLLSEQGAIFVSIGDKEVHTLRLLMDEVFGEECFVAHVARVAKRSSNAGEHFSPSKDHVLCYCRNIDRLASFSIPLSGKQIADFNRQDARGKYKEIGLYQAALKHGGSRYPIVCPDGTQVITPRPDAPWRWNEQTFLAGLERDLIVFKETGTSPLIDPDTGERSKWNVYTKLYLEGRIDEGMVPKDFIEEFQNSLATRELRALGLDFDFPKPTKLVGYLASLVATASNDLVLDFFAGSGTTASATMNANVESKANLRYILVQLPEPTTGEYPTISAITRERVRRAGKAIAAERAGALPLDGGAPLDLGFRAYTLAEGNILHKSGGGGF